MYSTNIDSSYAQKETTVPRMRITCHTERAKGDQWPRTATLYGEDIRSLYYRLGLTIAELVLDVSNTLPTKCSLYQRTRLHRSLLTLCRKLSCLIGAEIRDDRSEVALSPMTLSKFVKVKLIWYLITVRLLSGRTAFGFWRCQ